MKFKNYINSTIPYQSAFDYYWKNKIQSRGFSELYMNYKENAQTCFSKYKTSFNFYTCEDALFFEEELNRYNNKLWC